MMSRKLMATICSLSLMMATGAAVAGPMAPNASSMRETGQNLRVENVVMKGTMAGKKKQMSRTRTTYCHTHPSRC